MTLGGGQWPSCYNAGKTDQTLPSYLYLRIYSAFCGKLGKKSVVLPSNFISISSRPPADQSELYQSIVKFASHKESMNPGTYDIARCELILNHGIALLLQTTKVITAAAIPPNNSSISPINYVRHLVGSTSPNDKYLLLCLLETAEPRLWAGTDPQIPAVLDAFEVELIMQQLDSPDGLIRRKARSAV